MHRSLKSLAPKTCYGYFLVIQVILPDGCFKKRKIKKLNIVLQAMKYYNLIHHLSVCENWGKTTKETY